MGGLIKIVQCARVKPQVSDTWRADELWMKFKGDMKYVFAIMDDETRYWIAQEVAETKYKHDAKNCSKWLRGLLERNLKP